MVSKSTINRVSRHVESWKMYENAAYSSVYDSLWNQELNNSSQTQTCLLFIHNLAHHKRNCIDPPQIVSKHIRTQTIANPETQTSKTCTTMSSWAWYYQYIYIYIICTVYIHGIHAPSSNDRRRIWEHCRIVGLLTGLVPCSVRIQDICHITHSVADTWKWDWGSDLHVHMLSAKAGYCFHPKSARTGSLLRIVPQDKQHRHKELDNDEEVVQLGPQKTKK